ncbi:CHAP domain-containing protein, partial [Lactococcus garvieae]|nr:CHAP domain-containing protein [Lactococcus garvieae]
MKKIVLILAGLLTPVFLFFGLVLVLLGSMLSIGSQEDVPEITGGGSPPVTGEALKVATKTYQHLMK